MQPSILICGAGGMLGSELLRQYGEHAVGLCHTDLDITNSDAVNRVIHKLQPKCIINAAAYTAVDDAETQTADAYAVNDRAVGHLIAAANAVGARLVHISTDYVFNGTDVLGYAESSEPQPCNVYGHSKLAGENRIRAGAHDWYIIRTSWLFGRGGKNFVDTIRQLAFTKKELRVVDDQHGKPTFVVDLAAAIRHLIMHEYPSDVYHITNAALPEGITWYQFAQTIVDYLQLPCSVLPCTSEEFPRPARRPQYAVLRNTKLPELRPWQEALMTYLQSS